MCRFIMLKEGMIRVPVAVEDVVRFEGMSSYTNVYLKDGNVHKQCGHIGYWEDKVKVTGLFLRVHKSHLVHYCHIRSFSKIGGVLLKDKSRLHISVQGYINLQGFFT